MYNSRGRWNSHGRKGGTSSKAKRNIYKKKRKKKKKKKVVWNLEKLNHIELRRELVCFCAVPNAVMMLLLLLAKVELVVGPLINPFTVAGVIRVHSDKVVEEEAVEDDDPIGEEEVSATDSRTPQCDRGRSRRFAGVEFVEVLETTAAIGCTVVEYFALDTRRIRPWEPESFLRRREGPDKLPVLNKPVWLFAPLVLVAAAEGSGAAMGTLVGFLQVLSEEEELDDPPSGCILLLLVLAEKVTSWSNKKESVSESSSTMNAWPEGRRRPSMEPPILEDPWTSSPMEIASRTWSTILISCCPAVSANQGSNTKVPMTNKMVQYRRWMR
jgi:hypothetical protein